MYQMNESYVKRHLHHEVNSEHLKLAPGRRLIRDLCVAYFNTNAVQFRNHFQAITATSLSLDMTYKFA
jgi:hypothetical protein